MKTNKILALLLALLLALSCFGCTGTKDNTVATVGETPSAPPQPSGDGVGVTVTDMVGRQVEVIPGSYRRVVCVGAGALRLYSYIGDLTLLAGVEDIDNPSVAGRPAMFDSVARPYLMAGQPIFQALPSCGVGGPMAQTAEAEKILACEPDIVISCFEDADKENALQEQLGVPVITLSTGPDGVFDAKFAQSLQLLGTIFGKEERAQELADYVKAQAEEIGRRTAEFAGREDTPAVYVCGLGNWGTTNHLMTSPSYASFQIANIRNAAAGLSAPGVQPIEAEKFVELGSNMDIIILDAAAVKNIIPLYQQDPAMFDACKAWQEGQVYLEMAYNAYYTNFEIALLNTWFAAKTVYPQAFQDVDMTEKTNEVTKMFLGQELAEGIFSMPGSFGGYQQIDTATFFG